MIERMTTSTEQREGIFSNKSGTLWQRNCACEASYGMEGECQGCRKKGLNLQRRADHGDDSRAVPLCAVRSVSIPVVPPIVYEILRAPGVPLDSATRVSMGNRFAHFLDGPAMAVARTAAQSTLKVNHPGDRYEQEADRTAERVMRESDAGATPNEHAFSKVRVHADARAAESAQALGALAYTVGQDIVFRWGQYAPQSSRGQRLLAHELAHTLQQRGGADGMITGAWDSAAECADVPKDKWIQQVVVNQETPQTATVQWSDGSSESDSCSSGKGHCCVDAANPSGVACTIEGSHKDGSNCTPITRRMGFPVQNRVRNHKGVEFWTEFVPDRAIALHQYTPVDGTPLSHGCVRLNEATAKKVFCNVRQNQTWVQVQGFARPSCDSANLQKEWSDDFLKGGMDLSKADGDMQAEIREIRQELKAAFGRALSVDEIQKMTVDDIPRCTRTVPLPKPPAP